MLNAIMICFIASFSCCTMFNDPQKLEKIEKDVKDLAEDVIEDALPTPDVTNGNK